MIEDAFLDLLIREALKEDIGPGDITTEAIVPPHVKGRAEIIAKEPLILSGLEAATAVFRHLDPDTIVKWGFKNGDDVSEGDTICSLEGLVRGLLGAERVALNLLQRLSGIATCTRKFVKAMERAYDTSGKKSYLLDTRKTTPLWRKLEKEAVRHGGGKNHRFGLFDGILIKENHIVAAGGSVTEAIKRVKASAHHLLRIEVEVETLKQLEEAIAAGVDAVLLDNFDEETLEKALDICKGRIPLVEVSGGITLSNIRRFACVGADFISSGAITHSARSVDISMKLKEIFY